MLEGLIGRLLKHERFGSFSLTIERRLAPKFGETLHEVPERFVATCKVNFGGHDNDPGSGSGMELVFDAGEVRVSNSYAIGARVIALATQAIRRVVGPEIERAAPAPGRGSWGEWAVEQALRNAGLHAQCMKCAHIRAGAKEGDPPHCGAGPVPGAKKNMLGDCLEFKASLADELSWSKS